ncbi:MAG: nucleotidyltransferase family protein [Rhodoferax sp.]|nr:nucleotidyltransferase family protein [Rhodoferax sp.]
MTGDLLSPIWSSPARFPQFTLPEWETVLGQALLARLSGRLAQHLQDHGWLEKVPSQPRQYLEGALRLIDRQHHEVQWEVDCTRRALKDLDVPVILLKGAGYLIAELSPGRGRLFSDIDIMVKHEHLQAVEAALFRHGWISEERDAYNDRYYREWMHEIPPMKHVERHTVIDVHHTITPPTSRFKVPGKKLFERIVPVDAEANLFVLAPVDMVLHSSVHLFQEGEFSHGLRDLLDLNDLLQLFGKDSAFWPSLFVRAKELGLGEPLFHALSHSHRLFQASIPKGLLGEFTNIQPDWVGCQVTSLLLNLALQPHHPSCDGP